MTYRFPSLGKLMNFAFAMTGVLPRKRDEDDVLSEAEKKNIQKQLARLSDEEGNLPERHAELIGSLAFLLAGTLDNHRAVLVMGEVAMDILDVYRAVIRDEGTYLDERDSVAWFARCFAVPRLAMSVKKQVFRLNMAASGIATPQEEFWFLPSFSDTGMVWPLANAMRWVYERCDVSQTHFHHPGRGALVEERSQVQNLENARDWVAGCRMPSWAGLHWNFTTSFDRLAAASEPTGAFTAQFRQSMVHTLFIARVSIYVCKALEKARGIEFVRELCDQYRRHWRMLDHELSDFEKAARAHVEQYQASAEDADQMLFQASEEFWSWFTQKAGHFGRTAHLLYKQSEANVADESMRAMKQAYGELIVNSTLEFVELTRQYHPPEGFAEAMREGQRLLCIREIGSEDIDGYERYLEERNQSERLAWISPWLRAELAYRAEDFKTAFRNGPMSTVLDA